jgi:hypothetical protein
MSSFDRFAAFSQWCEVPGAEGMFPTAFKTPSASAVKSRATPPIPNANTEAVPRINFLIMVISRVSHVGKSSSYYSEQSVRAPRSSWAAVSDLGQAAQV